MTIFNGTNPLLMAIFNSYLKLPEGNPWMGGLPQIDIGESWPQAALWPATLETLTEDEPGGRFAAEKQLATGYMESPNRYIKNAGCHTLS
jgi:hypothetical protein